MSTRVWLTLAIVATLDRGAAAQQPAQRALQLFEDGRALAKKGDYAGACAKFGESFALDSTNPGVALNIADCREREGKLAEAWKRFGALADDFDRKKDTRAKFARDRAAALEPKLAVLTITLPQPVPEGIGVTIDKQRVSTTGTILERRDPGAVEIAATAPGKKPFRAVAQLTAGPKTIGIVFEAEPVATPTQPAEPSTRRHRGRVKLAIGLGVGGLGALAVTGVVSVLAKGKYNDAINGPECTKEPLVCTPAGGDKVDSARSLARVGTVLGVAGGLAVASAVVVYLTAPRERMVVPVASETTLGLAVVGRW